VQDSIKMANVLMQTWFMCLALVVWVSVSDVTKLVKVRILTFKICRMRTVAFIL